MFTAIAFYWRIFPLFIRSSFRLIWRGVRVRHGTFVGVEGISRRRYFIRSEGYRGGVFIALSLNLAISGRILEGSAFYVSGLDLKCLISHPLSMSLGRDGFYESMFVVMREPSLIDEAHAQKSCNDEGRLLVDVANILLMRML